MPAVPIAPAARSRIRFIWISLFTVSVAGCNRVLVW